MNEVVGHWVGSAFEWPCPSCGAVLQGRRPCSVAAAMCNGCGSRALLLEMTSKLARLASLVGEVERERNDLRLAVKRLELETSEQLDDIFELRTRERSGGLSEQARNALALARQYIDEGDDLATSERLRHCVLQAIATAAEAASEAA